MPEMEIFSHGNQVNTYPGGLAIVPGYNRVDKALVKAAMDACDAFRERVESGDYEVHKISVAVGSPKSEDGDG